MGFPRQEYWSGLSFPSPGNLPDPEINPPMDVQSVNLKQRRQIYTMGNKISSISDAVKTRQLHVKE